MTTAIVIIVILGVGGYLVYRNNKAKADALAAQAKATAEKAAAEIKAKL